MPALLNRVESALLKCKTAQPLISTPLDIIQRLQLFIGLSPGESRYIGVPPCSE